jgi:hypothetical protein
MASPVVPPSALSVPTRGMQRARRLTGWAASALRSRFIGVVITPWRTDAALLQASRRSWPIVASHVAARGAFVICVLLVGTALLGSRANVIPPLLSASTLLVWAIAFMRSVPVRSETRRGTGVVFRFRVVYALLTASYAVVGGSCLLLFAIGARSNAGVIVAIMLGMGFFDALVANVRAVAWRGPWGPVHS